MSLSQSAAGRAASGPSAASRTRTSIGRLASLYNTSVGKKAVMSVTGMGLLLFVIAHMLGNLKIYFGPEEFNRYAEHLREIGLPILSRTMALWIVRIILLSCVGLHMIAAYQLAVQSRQARETPYYVKERLAFSYASYTMRWGGLVILFFVIYHILDLTLGVVHPEFVPDSVYHNVVHGFQRWPIALIYITANIVLGFHLYHGLWSAFQTLGINNPKYSTWRRPTALAVSLIIVIGNVSIPVSVLTGIIRDVPK